MLDTLFIEEHKIADHYVVQLLKSRDAHGEVHMLGVFSDETFLDGGYQRKQQPVEKKQPEK